MKIIYYDKKPHAEIDDLQAMTITAGNLTKDPEMRTMPNGNPVANFTVATNDYYTQNGEKKEKTEL